MNKFEAAREFADGYTFAVCRGSGRPKWESELFNAGYKYGSSVKAAYYSALNDELSKRGIPTIGTIKTCENNQ